MAKNIFQKTNDRVEKPNRNTFDLSFQNNLTMNFGGLYPVFCKEVLPGDSFRIKPTFGLRFMPMTFPIQTRMRANLHFFYVRNRNLWKDWMDFIGKTKDVTPPYLSGVQEIKTGSIYDMFGLPTTRVGDYGNSVDVSSSTSVVYNNGNSSNRVPGLYAQSNETLLSYTFIKSQYDIDITSWSDPLTYVYGDIQYVREQYLSHLKNASAVFVGSTSLNTSDTPSGFQFNFTFPQGAPKKDQLFYLPLRTSSYAATNNLPFGTAEQSIPLSAAASDTFDVITASDSTFSDAAFARTFKRDSGSINQVSFVAASPSHKLAFLVLYIPLTWNDSSWSPVFSSASPYGPRFDSSVVNIEGDGYVFTMYGFDFGSYNPGNIASPSTVFPLVMGDSSYDTVDIDLKTQPYYSSSYPSGLKISSLPFRAYETIYNCFYRDSRNNPLIIDGQPEYNKFLTSTDGGADNFQYSIRQRNWEKDFLTTAVQSPQQGIAPLVGISSTGSMTFADEAGNVYRAQAKFADDGSTITGFAVQSPNMPQGTLRALVDYASSGISINDFRNVNALQRWLEQNMRHGLRYRDQIESHFGVTPRYDELDYPEFIGGMSQDVSVNQVTQTAQQSSDGDFQGVLGSYAGQAYCVGQGESVTHYCDEHGFIIGILSVVPVPNYSQLLPKVFLKNHPLDYFFTEFGHIGMQAIRYDEVCPVQAKNAGDSFDKIFGYQRAWYDYLASTDEVHGLFRTSLKNFVMNRTFDVPPSLSESFLLVDPKQLNEVFSVTDTDDKILGQIYFDVSAKRPIPLFGIPRLE